MVKICPISKRQINENISRLNGVFTFLLIASYFISGTPVLLIILLIDFVLRNIYEGKMSPSVRLNSFIVQVADIPVHLINAGPKIFAARVGLIFSLTVVFLFYFGSPSAAIIPLIILGIFSFMEAAFNYCVACKLYPYLLPINKFLNKRTRD